MSETGRNFNLSVLNVQSSITGLIKSSNVPLKFYPGVKIVVRDDAYNFTGVKLVSGGGAGHEPAQCGYVGRGMLTAAISGEIFASPSVGNIVAGIRSCGPPGSGVLLIVTNYTGDRLNFGLAAEVARNQFGYNVKTLLVDDDCSIDDLNVKRSVGRRGLAGTILIHKIVGAMAEMGKSLDEIHGFIEEILRYRRLLTVGFSFDIIDDLITNVEIGKGLHGEPGAQRLDAEFKDFSTIVKICLSKFQSHLNCLAQDPQLVIMFNNLGGVSELIFQRFQGEFLNELNSINNIRVLSGRFFTSLNTQGISVTVLHLINPGNLSSPRECTNPNWNHLLEYLNCVVEVSANVNLYPINLRNGFCISQPELIPEILSKAQIENVLSSPQRPASIMSEKYLRKIIETIRSQKELLNVMDSEFGDGDTGSLTSLGVSQIEEALNSNRINFSSTSSMLVSLSSEIQKCMGGTFGAVCCLFFQGAALVNDDDGPTFKSWSKRLAAGIECVQKYSLAAIGDRTMLDILQPVQIVLRDSFGDDPIFIKSVLKHLFDVATREVDQTKTVPPLSGRAAYTIHGSERFSAQYSDPGSYVVLLIIQSIYQGFEEFGSI